MYNINYVVPTTLENFQPNRALKLSLFYQSGIRIIDGGSIYVVVLQLGTKNWISAAFSKQNIIDCLFNLMYNDIIVNVKKLEHDYKNNIISF